MEESGVLYYGDNIDILRKYIKTESIDLIYLDPPFNSKVNYNVIFKTKNKEDAPAQIQAFEDTWNWGKESEMAYAQIMGMGDRVADVLAGLRQAIGENNMLTYVTMMTIRLLELHRVLKPTGSMYLHCDPTASHYLKIILDAIFGSENFQNEIIWQKIRVKKAQTKGFGNVHDVILSYRKSDLVIFNENYLPHSEKYIQSHWNSTDENDRRYRLVALDQQGKGPPRRFNDKLIDPPSGKHWIWSQERIDRGLKDGIIVFTKNMRPRIKKFLDEMKGNNITDIWIDISPLNAVSKERMGYPTQKPITLLERIIKSSSNEGDIILDPFCGCGTAVAAAQKLNRKWIGIDITHLAIALMEERLITRYNIKPKIIGEPKTIDAAKELAKRNPFQFEAWAVSKILGMHPTKKTGDKGIDGRGYVDIGDGKFVKVVMSVKGGHLINPSMIQALKGAMQRANADLGIFMCLKNPSKGMITEAATSGLFETPLGQKFPKCQIYTIEDYFKGLKPELPNLVTQDVSLVKVKQEMRSKIIDEFIDIESDASTLT